MPNPLGRALRNRHAGHHTLVWARPDVQAPENFTLTSPAFDHGTPIPERHRGRNLWRPHLARPRLDDASGGHRRTRAHRPGPGRAVREACDPCAHFGHRPGAPRHPGERAHSPEPGRRTQTRQGRPRPPRLGRAHAHTLPRPPLLRVPTLRPRRPTRAARQVQSRRRARRHGRKSASWAALQAAQENRRLR